MRRIVCGHLKFRLDDAALELTSLVNVSAEPEPAVRACADGRVLPARDVRDVGQVGKDLLRRTRDLDRELEARQR
jgi:hypothetical protein